MQNTNMKMRKISILIVFLITAIVSNASSDSTRVTTSLKWQSEGNWNMTNGKCNFLDLLEAGIHVKLWKGASIHADMLSAYNQRLENDKSASVADDKQMFTNLVLQDKLPLALYEFDIEQIITDNFKIRFGVRNMNADYFASPYTSLLTNASNGIFPTIADNFSVGNYPTASMCLHLEWNITKNITLRNSLSNGKSSTKWDEVFRVRPNADGIINLTEISYEANENSSMPLLGSYHAGIVYGNIPKDGETKKHSDYSIYGLVEQPLISGEKKLGLLLQGGYSPKSKNDTYGYFGAAIEAGNIIRKDDEAGVAVNRALYNGGEHETDVEITYKIPVIEHLKIQPAIHFIRTTGESNTVGLLRAIVEF